jgi:hypothetical protein
MTHIAGHPDTGTALPSVPGFEHVPPSGPPGVPSVLESDGYAEGEASSGPPPSLPFDPMLNAYEARIRQIMKENQFTTFATGQHFAKNVLGIDPGNLRGNLTTQQILNQQFGPGGGVQNQAVGIQVPGGRFTPFFGAGASDPGQAQFAQKLGLPRLDPLGSTAFTMPTGRRIPTLTETPQQKFARTGVVPESTDLATQISQALAQAGLDVDNEFSQMLAAILPLLSSFGGGR